MGRIAVSVRVIETDADVTTDASALCEMCPRLASAYAQTGQLPLRRKPDGFAELLSAIVSQQVSVASANAIWARMQEAGLTAPATVLRAGDDGLRAAGLSRQKIRYAQELARAGIDWDALRAMPTDAVLKTLTQVPGIGTWTAEIYAMFSLGHADVFAHGDLALQEAARILYDLPERPNERAMRVIAADWSPYRSVAARLLWAYYRIAKQREGIR